MWMCVSPCSKLLWSGVPVPPPAVMPPDASLSGSLRLTLSLEPKRTRAPERELMSGDVSDSPGRSSALVGVTVKRTDAIATRLEKVEGEGKGVEWDAGGEGWGFGSGQGLASRAVLTWAELGYLPGDAEVTAASIIYSFAAELLHWSKVVGCNQACERKSTTGLFLWLQVSIIFPILLEIKWIYSTEAEILYCE